jgi:hypothetical protein
LAEFRDQRNLSTSLPVLVDQKRLIGLLDILVVACLVVLLVGDLKKDYEVKTYLSSRLVKCGVWALSEVDAFNTVGLLIVPKIED